MKFFDIHSHMIPGVDDGSESMENSLRMLQSTYYQGTRALAATSHSCAYDADAAYVRNQFGLLKRESEKLLPDLKLYLGCEVYCGKEIMDEVLEKLNNQTYPTLNGTKYVLMEFSQWVQEKDTFPCIEKLLNAGWKVIIAHIERYRLLEGKTDAVDRFQKMGALLQVNAYSLGEERRKETLQWTRNLVMQHRISVLGSDAHRLNHRPPNIKSGLEWLYANTDREYAENISWRNAKQMLIQSEE